LTCVNRGAHAAATLARADLDDGESGHVDELRAGPDVQLALPRT
jgi:hypothetical protein